ncbi:MAG: lamin tail domain-containing protein [Bacteroidota bacterium]|nr:lamin tail domain-containing protein [Bacteroidota bacterium]
MKKHLLFKLFTLTFALLMSVGWVNGQQTLIISEVADPGDIYQARFVELYNATSSSIDLTGWQVRRYANSNTTSSDVDLSGSIASGETYVIASNTIDFETNFGFAPDAASGYISGSGDDTYELFNGTSVVDIYGEVGVDGTGEAWEYEDSRAVRVATVGTANTTWTASEWTITAADVADMTPGEHTCDYPEITDEPDWYNLQWPVNGTIDYNGTFSVYAQVYEPGVTDAAGQGAGIEAWIGVSPEDTDPATWTTWIDATYNNDDVNNDEYMADIGSNLAPGTYYYASRFSLNNGPYVYGGLDGGAWDGTTNVSGVLTVNSPSTALPYEEMFDTDLGNCFVYSVAGTNPWENNSGAAYANGYNGENPEEHWLVLPAIDFDSYADEVMNFTTFAQYGTIDANNYLKLFYSTDYPGTGDPTGYTWTELTFDLPASVGTTEVETPSGDIDLTGITGTEVYLAFKYYSSDNPTGWKVDDINIYEEQPPTTLAITSVEPASPFTGQSFNITVESQDDSQIASEVDQDTEVKLLLAAGSGNLSGTLTGTIANGTSSVTITGLTYDVGESIEVSATVNSGMALTDATSQIIEVNDIPVVEVPYLRDFETGDINTDGWSTQLVIGTLDWYIDDDSGNHFAKMSNYSGGNQPSETWLITPGIDLSTAVSPVFSFMNACDYSGADIEVKISTDYDGFSDPSIATWTNLSPTLSTGGYDNVSSGELDLSAYTGGTAYIAFKYTGTDLDGKIWQIDDVSIALSDDATLSTFTLGGEDVTGLTDLEVADPVNDAGATLYVTDITGFEGIDIDATNSAATVTVELNGSVVDPGNYATQALADGDVVVATVEAEDGTIAYYKVTIIEENRELEITGPALPAIYETGDDVMFTWTSANIDTVNIYAVDTEEAYLINEEGVVDATLGTYTYTIANGDFGTFTIRIADASDETFFDETTEEATVNDIQHPEGIEFYPAMGAVDVPLSFTLSVLFDEDVVAGTGNFTIYDAFDDSEVLNFTEADFTINEDVLTVNVTGLDYETEYYILADGGIIEDLSGNAAPVLDDPTTWTFTTKTAPESDLFFSEYIEGSGDNKALEIFNPTASDIDLSNYVIRINYNGNLWNGVFEFPAGTILPSEEVYVIAHAGADAAILAETDTAVVNPYSGGESYVAVFNGDDVRALCKVEGTDTTIIDIIGRYDLEDPGSGWSVAGVDNATSNHTLIRKSSIIVGNPDWDSSAGTNETDSEWIVLEEDNFENIGTHSVGLSDEAEILDFTFGTAIDYEDAVIDSELATVDISVINGTDVTELYPTISISDYATIDPESGDTIDFTNPVIYTVTAQDGVTTKDWTVTVTELTELSDKANILEVQLAGVDSININETDTTVTIYAPYGFDVTSVKPEFTVSAGASIADTAAARDFTDPQVYEVTAQDGSTIKNWEVAIDVVEATAATIYDIQFTEDASGDSPYLGEFVLTSGIVTYINSSNIWIQDGSGAWNGVMIYSSDMAGAVAIGDEVEFAAEVDEYYELTELKNVVGLTVVSSGNDLPAAAEISTLEANDEDYESVLVKVSDATCTNADTENNFGMFVVDDGSGAILIDDVFYAFTPTLDNVYDITGIADYSYSERKILPRNGDDIVDVTTGINNPDEIVSMNVYPNPSNGQFTFEMNASKAGTFKVEIINIQGQVVYQKQITQDGFYREFIDISDKARGMYYIRLNDGQSMKIAKIMIQ